MSNPILEGFGKGESLNHVYGGGLYIGKTAAPVGIGSYEVISEGRNVALGFKTAAVAGLATAGPGAILGAPMALKKKRLAKIVWVNEEESLVDVRSAALHKALVMAAFR